MYRIIAILLLLSALLCSCDSPPDDCRTSNGCYWDGCYVDSWSGEWVCR
jgi:hypothetical protein